MSFTLCCFNEELGCSVRKYKQYQVYMPDMGIYMMVPEMWEHYATNHLVLPTDQERELVMAADPDTAIGNMKNQFFSRERAGVPVLYVERIDGEYSHKIGNKPDTEFINKLERLVGGIAPWARTF